MPDERLRFLLRDGEVRFVLTAEGLREFPDDVRPFTVADFDGESEEDLESVQQATDLAYVICTSGSASDRATAISGLHFDLSVYDLFGVLTTGGCAVVPEPGEQQDPAHWLDLVREHGVTFWNSVPALVELLVDNASPGDLDSLRHVVMAGDWIPLTLPDRLRALAPSAELASAEELEGSPVAGNQKSF